MEVAIIGLYSPIYGPYLIKGFLPSNTEGRVDINGNKLTVSMKFVAVIGGVGVRTCCF